MRRKWLVGPWVLGAWGPPKDALASRPTTSPVSVVTRCALSKVDRGHGQWEVRAKPI